MDSSCPQAGAKKAATITVQATIEPKAFLDTDFSLRKEDSFASRKIQELKMQD
jgi:hypothetical protein